MTQVEEILELDPLPADVNEIISLLQSMLLVLSQHSQSLSVVHHVPQIKLYPPPKFCLFSQALQTQPFLSLAYLLMPPQSFFSYYNYCYDVPLDPTSARKNLFCVCFINCNISVFNNMQKIQGLNRISLCIMKSGK